MVASIAFGEALIDEYPDRRVVAGAPLHVAVHFAAAGWRSMLWTRIGADADGAAISDTIEAFGVDGALVQVDRDTPTGTVHIELPEQGEHTFTIGSPAAWDHIAPVDPLPGHDVFYFGSLAMRNPESAQTLWHVLEPGNTRFCIFDVNLRPPFDDLAAVQRGLGHAALVKMNAEEFERVCRALGTPTDAASLFDRFDELQFLCVTRGSNGARLHLRDGTSEQVAPRSIEPVDTVGAGDAFAAGLSIGLVTGESPRRALARADELARSVLRVRGGLAS